MVSFQTKNQIWVHYWGPYNGKCLFILWPFGIFTSIWYNVWPFEIVCGHLEYFSHFGMFGPRKIWQPWILRSRVTTIEIGVV
jgi:hypothetical protein